jgi:hypothetical protein
MQTTTHALPLLSLAFLASAAAAAPTLGGWSEQVRIELVEQPLRAKLDTGAASSSLDARQIELVRGTDGMPQVRFTLELPGQAASMHERPLVRTTRIKRHSGPAEERPVIELEVCLGGVVRTTQVNLVDRERFEMPMLLGRDFLAGAFLVDPAATDLLEPSCVRNR